MTSDRDVVEAFLAAVKDLSAREAAAVLSGVSHDDVARWRRGEWKRLTAAKRRALLRFLEGGVDTEESADGLAAPNYEGLGIDIPERARLHPRPLAMFDRFVHQLLDMGFGREDIEYWGRTVLAPIAHLNTLHRGREESDATTEEEQTWIVERNVDAALRIIERRRR